MHGCGSGGVAGEGHLEEMHTQASMHALTHDPVIPSHPHPSMHALTRGHVVLPRTLGARHSPPPAHVQACDRARMRSVSHLKGMAWAGDELEGGVLAVGNCLQSHTAVPPHLGPCPRDAVVNADFAAVPRSHDAPTRDAHARHPGRPMGIRACRKRRHAHPAATPALRHRRTGNLSCVCFLRYVHWKIRSIRGVTCTCRM